MRRLHLLPVLPILFATSVAAMSISSIIKQAEVIKVNAVTAATSTAITVSTTIRGFAANDPYQIKSLDIPKTRFLSGVKGGFGTGGIGSLAKSNAYYAAWLATMAAAGWAIDELTDQVTYRPPSPITNYFPDSFYPSGGCSLYSGSLGIGTRTGVSIAGCLQPLGIYNNFKVTSNYTKAGSYYWANITFCINSDCNKNGYIYVFTSTAPYPYTPPSVPVSDDSLFDSLINYMLQDPTKASQAFMVPDAWPYPYPQIFPDTVPYIPGVAESDEEALNWYLQGLAQSNDPNAPYYVAPEKLQQIASLAQALQQGLTPEGQTEALNENLKSPLTQSQLEETLKKRDAANKKEAEEISATDKKPITDAYKDSGTKDEYDKLKERVSDPTKLPQLPPLPAADQIDLPIHTPCRTITMNMFNAVLTFPNPDQCAKLEQVKTGFGYLLYMLTALGIIFELYRRVE